MRTFALAAFAATASAAGIRDVAQYIKYLTNFGKSYSNLSEFTMRAELFFTANQMIDEHNQTNASFTLGHNQFSDMTTAERDAHLGYKAPTTEKVYANVTATPNGEADWRGSCVTPVKNQASCGSCWSFSSTGALEGAHCVKSGELLSFSEQQLVDCDPIDQGCNGGYQEYAFQYLQENAIIEESEYPYKGVGGSCQQDSKADTGIYVDEITHIDAGSPDAMKAVLDQQPIAVAIQADKLVFQLYNGGIFDSEKCGTQLDHAVLLVGYGSENGQEYFILKNSWDTTWGEEGFMRIAVSDGDGICGVQMDPLYATTTQ